MFSELFSPENEKRLEIDPRLRGPLKNVLKKMDAYFAKHGYEGIRDYKELLETGILMPPESKTVQYSPGGGYMQSGAWKRKFIFQISDEPGKIGAVGLYSGNSNRRFILDTSYEYISMDEEFMNTASPIEIEKVLCHEFIHFLVMSQRLKNQTDLAILGGGFVNEALTEMLAQEIYPGVYPTYGAQVNMVRFANLLTENVSNFKRFLDGHVDFKGDSSEPHTWDKFMEYAQKYHDSKNPDDYLQAQRFLIEHSIHYRMNSDVPMTMSDYLDVCTNIETKSPVEDRDWQERYLGRVDKIFLEKVLEFKHEDIEKVAPLLSEVRELTAKKRELENPNIFNQRFMGMEFEFKRNDDGTFDVSINGSVVRTNQNGVVNLSGKDFTINLGDLRKGKISIVNNNDKSSVDLNVSEYVVRQRQMEAEQVDKKLKARAETLKNKFLKNDLAILSSEKYDYTDVERVTIPGLTFEEPSSCAYIVHLADGSTVALDSQGEEIKLTEMVENRKISELKGLAGGPTSFLYQLEKRGEVPKAYLGELAPGKQILLYQDEKGQIQIARADETFAFVGRKTNIYDSQDRGTLNDVFPSIIYAGKQTKKGTIVNVENYELEQGQNLNEQDLLQMVKGLDPKKRFAAMEYIRELSKGKDENSRDNK